MKQLNKYISESIFDIDDEQVINKKTCPTPANRKELLTLIRNEYNRKSDYSPTDVLDLNFIDTSKIEDFSTIFRYFDRCNIDVSQWDVSNATNMTEMFENCVYFNCDLSKWRMPKCTSMKSMFCACKNFNGDVSGWEVENVTDMREMFADCDKFEGHGLETWNPKTIEAEYMFTGCEKLKADLSAWTNVVIKTCTEMFYNCFAFNSALPNWTIDTNYLQDMFTNCEQFEGRGLDTWITKKAIKNLRHTFDNCKVIKFDISKWKLSKSLEYDHVFFYCKYMDETMIKNVNKRYIY